MWLAEYAHPETRRRNRAQLAGLVTGRDVTTISPGEVVQWCVGPPGRANNTVRNTAASVRMFWAWCVARDLGMADIDAVLARLRRSYPALYGRAQGVNPARWLSSEEVSRLLNACQDGTWMGSRDQLIVRWGLLGLRLSDLTSIIRKATLERSVACRIAAEKPS